MKKLQAHKSTLKYIHFYNYTHSLFHVNYVEEDTGKIHYFKQVRRTPSFKMHKLLRASSVLWQCVYPAQFIFPDMKLIVRQSHWKSKLTSALPGSYPLGEVGNSFTTKAPTRYKVLTSSENGALCSSAISMLSKPGSRSGIFCLAWLNTDLLNTKI